MVARLRDAIQRGDTASKPAANAVDVGTLYFDTDLDKLQRSNGTTWEDVERADPGAGSGALTLISQVVLAADATKIEFSGIAGTYKGLLLTARLRSDRAAANNDSILLQVGHTTIDTGANYDYARTSDGAATAATAGATFIATILAPAANAAANYFGAMEVRILNYAVATHYREVVFHGTAISDVSQNVTIGGGVWKNTSSTIDIIRLSPNSGTNLKAGSKVQLYGVN